MKVPVIPFTLDERSNPEGNIQSLSMDFLYESHQVISAAEIILWYVCISVLPFFFFFVWEGYQYITIYPVINTSHTYMTSIVRILVLLLFFSILHLKNGG